MNTDFELITLCRIVMKLESVTLEADGLSTRPSDRIP